MGGKAKKKDRRSLTGFIRSIFSSPSKSIEKKKSGKLAEEEPYCEKIEFGVAETEKLQHFQRPRPPQNRRPPRATNARGLGRPNGQSTMPAIAEDQESCPRSSPKVRHRILKPPSWSNDGQAKAPPPIPPNAVKPRERLLSESWPDNDEEYRQKRMSQSVPNLCDGQSDSKVGEEMKTKPERRSFWNIFHRKSASSRKSMDLSDKSDWDVVSTQTDPLATPNMGKHSPLTNEDGSHDPLGGESVELRKNSRNLESRIGRSESLRLDEKCHALKALIKPNHMSMPTEPVT